MEKEHIFSCPHCWQKISMVIDLSVEEKIFIEDCDACSHQIVVSYTTKDGQLDRFKAERLDQ